MWEMASLHTQNINHELNKALLCVKLLSNEKVIEHFLFHSM